MLSLSVFVLFSFFWNFVDDVFFYFWRDENSVFLSLLGSVIIKDSFLESFWLFDNGSECESCDFDVI